VRDRTRHGVGNEGRRRRAAAWTLLQYVVCGLSLTAHIAFADHHCELHHLAGTGAHSHRTTISARTDCTFDHHSVEAHHDEAVGKTGPMPAPSTATVPAVEGVFRVETDAPLAAAQRTGQPRASSCAPPPSRAPPASLPV